MGRTFSG